MSLETQVQQVDSNVLDELFKDIPESTPNANTLVTGREGEINNGSSINNVDYIDDIDALEVISKTPEEIAADVEAQKAAEAAAKVDEPENETEEAKAERLKAEQEAADAAKAAEDQIDVTAVNEVLKSTVEYLITSGQWADFDGREDLEITQEVYAQLVAKQDEHRISQMFGELLDSTGDYGKAIISHIKKGGNPDEIIDLFKEQKQIEQIDSSTETGKQSLIEKYYSEVLKWKPEKVQKIVKRLIEDNEIESEFGDVKDLYDKHYQEKLEEIQQEAAEHEKVLKQKEETFKSNIKTALNSDATLSQRDKSLIASSILEFKHDLGNGQKVNDFYVKFAEIQSDPKEYIDLVRFVMNKQNYLKQIQTKEKSNAAAEQFNFIKGNAAIGKAKGTQIEINNEAARKSPKGTDFSFAFKNK